MEGRKVMAWDITTYSGKEMLKWFDRMIAYMREDLGRCDKEERMWWSIEGALFAFEEGRKTLIDLLPYAELDATRTPEDVAAAVRAWRSA